MDALFFAFSPLFCNSVTFALILSAGFQFFHRSCISFSPVPSLASPDFGSMHFLFPAFCSSPSALLLSFFFFFLSHLFFPNLCREESFYCTVPITPIKREVEELNTIDEVSRVARLEVQGHLCIILLRSARIPPRVSCKLLEAMIYV